MSHEPTPSESSSPFGSLFLAGATFLVAGMMGIPGIYFLSNIAGNKVVAAPVAAADQGEGTAPEAPAPGTPSAVVAAGALPQGVDQATFDLGKATFATCAACHGVDGQGLKAGPLLMAPSFTGSKLLLDPNPDKAILVVLKGIAKEDANFLGIMAALGPALDDQKIAGVLTYLRNSFGNSGPSVTVQQVAAARAKYADLSVPAGVSRKQIDSIVGAK